MRIHLFLACAALMLQSCDKPKDRSAAIAAQQQAAKAAGPRAEAGLEILSRGLPLKPDYPGFYLDTIGAAFDPLTKPAVVQGGANLEMSGFGFDPVAKLPAKGVDLEVDGELFATEYGHARQDVADNQKVPALVPVGYRTTLPKTLARGEHQVVVRVIAADGSGYYASHAIKFRVE